MNNQQRWIILVAFLIVSPVFLYFAWAAWTEARTVHFLLIMIIYSLITLTLWLLRTRKNFV